MYPKLRTIFIFALLASLVSVRAFMQTLLSKADDLDHASTMSKDEENSLNTEYSEAIIDLVNQHLPKFQDLEDFYRRFHKNPELSRQEKETSKITAKHLSSLGYHVQTNVGGFGVIGVLENGDGPRILLRADMDALPVKERTCLPYASTIRVLWEDGKEYPVMHACGHDMNTAVLMATAKLLMSAKSHWKGTVVCLFQPSEEAGGGAMAMVKDSLHEKVPKPNIILGQHVVPTKAGSVSIRSGPVMAGSDSYNVRIFGRGGHGAKPNLAINPIFIGAHIVNRLPEIVTTKIPPGEFAIINIGSIHAGDAENVIPDHLDMKLTMRHSKTELRDILHKQLVKVIEAECQASGSPSKPNISIFDSSPPTVNDDQIVSRIWSIFKDHFKDDAFEMPFDTASEEFSDLATQDNIPYAYWNFG